MNKFKKAYSGRTSTSHTGSGRPSYGPARPRTAGHRDSRSFSGKRNETANGAFQKFDAVCSNCGKRCQVPFRPDGTKPVYCKDCFGTPREALAGKKKFSASAGSAFSAPASAAGGKSIADLTRQIAAMNTKIDTMLRLLQEGGGEEE
ncbi:MAG TPA: CxxC-x17-CxxC domain-containing protein [Candidatus Paceibacterota bacterium]